MAVALAVLQQIDPSTKFVSRFENANRTPLTSLEKDNGWPVNTRYFSLYFMMERRWTLNNPMQEGKPTEMESFGQIE